MVCTPVLRDERGIVVSWKILQKFTDMDKAVKALDYYELEGFKAVILSTIRDETEFPNLILSPELTAKYVRCLLDANYTG